MPLVCYCVYLPLSRRTSHTPALARAVLLLLWLFLEHTPFGRILRPDDVATLAVYLLSDASEMMTGALIDFDQNVMGAYD